jgi:hypothetical protein
METGFHESMRGIALALRTGATQVDERRVALGRYALVWWEGDAADAYQQRVAARVTALATLSARMEDAGRAIEALLDVVDAGDGPVA